ncbi:MAG: efflux RND transporter periplasmic adaptor subunit [Pelosinus sp.]|nr:efflux RND transporter periplasmic adaptor subunit [Pelosinus sp.]
MRYQRLKGLSKVQVFSIVGIILILVAGFAVYKQKYAAGSQTSKSKMQATVDVTAVQRTDLLKRISLSGQTVPEAQVDVAPKYQGRVAAVNVTLGQQVSAGDVLVIQDTGDGDISIAQNRAAYQQASADAISTESTVNANYDKARADYQRALDSYQRSKTLYDVGGISKDSLDASQQQVADAKAALDTLTNQMNSGVAASIQSSRAAALKAQQSINAAEKQRDDLILRAPRSGVIGYRQVEVGNIAPAGQKILSIFDNSNIYVDCQVSEQDLGAFSVGMDVNVGLESLGKTVPGKVVYISPASDAQSMTFSLRIALVNPDPAVKSGMFARSVVNVPLRKNALVIPKDAVQEKNSVYYVYVVDAHNTIVQRTVEVGARGDDKVEILSGLNEGETVALTNLSRLRPGMTIVPNNAQTDKG